MLSDLKSKISLTMGFILILCAMGAWLVTDRVVMPSFTNLEFDAARTNLQRIEDALNREIETLNMTCNDYARWDDTYNYMDSADPDYIESNFGVATFQGCQLNFCYLVKPDGTVLWHKAYLFDPDLEEPAEYLITEIPSEKFPPDHHMLIVDRDIEQNGLSESWHSGIRLINGYYTLFACRPVITSEGEGPCRGTLIFGRFLDKSLIDALSQITHLDFKILPCLTHYPLKLKKEDKYLIRLDPESNLVASALICDYADYPLFKVSIKQSAGIIQKGRNTIGMVILFLVLLFIIMLIILRSFINRTIIKPIDNLSQHIKSIIKSGTLNTFQNNNRNDQIGILTRQYNQLMDELNQKNNLLELAAVTDGMTGIYNQRYMIDRLKSEIVRCRQENAIFSLAIIDIDNFKTINDTCGHSIGDKIILAVGAILLTGLHDSDLLGRYGGDEFIIILPDQDAYQAYGTLDIIRRNIQKMEFRDTHIPISISAGIQTWAGQSNTLIFSQADELLYQAKANGRNCIIYQTENTAVANPI